MKSSVKKMIPPTLSFIVMLTIMNVSTHYLGAHPLDLRPLGYSRWEILDYATNVNRIAHLVMHAADYVWPMVVCWFLHTFMRSHMSNAEDGTLSLWMTVAILFDWIENLIIDTTMSAVWSGKEGVSTYVASCMNAATMLKFVAIALMLLYMILILIRRRREEWHRRKTRR